MKHNLFLAFFFLLALFTIRTEAVAKGCDGVTLTDRPELNVQNFASVVADDIYTGIYKFRTTGYDSNNDLENEFFAPTTDFQGKVWSKVDDGINDNLLENGVTIFVPGTNSEDGCPRQFEKLYTEEAVSTGRLFITISYLHDIDGTPGAIDDATRYDRSVEHGVFVLEALLTKLDGKTDDVQVYGHSKGAHIVSHVAVQDRWVDKDAFRFWAFAQPGRTEVRQKTGTDLLWGPLGDAGKIQRHTDTNLVTINWENDEVRYYKERKAGIRVVPNAFKYPGEVNDPAEIGGFEINRIDHHDNYGANYLDFAGCPYLATGDDAYFNDFNVRYQDPVFYRWLEDEPGYYNWLEDSGKTVDMKMKRGLFCNTFPTRFNAWFWGDPECTELALAAMYYDPNETAQTPDQNVIPDPEQIWPVMALNPDTGLWEDESSGGKYTIGTSGPRGIKCKPLDGIEAQVHLRYQYEADNGNRKGFKVRFRDYNKSVEAHDTEEITSINPFSGRDGIPTGWYDTGWFDVTLPNSFMVQIDPLSRGSANWKNKTIDIAWMKIRFTHPVTNERTYRYIIGPQCTGRFGKFRCDDQGLTPFEGQSHFGRDLAGKKYSGWNRFIKNGHSDRARNDVSNWRIFKRTESWAEKDQKLEVLRLNGAASAPSAGFYKFYSLLD